MMGKQSLQTNTHLTTASQAPACPNRTANLLVNVSDIKAITSQPAPAMCSDDGCDCKSKGIVSHAPATPIYM